MGEGRYLQNCDISPKSVIFREVLDICGGNRGKESDMTSKAYGTFSANFEITSIALASVVSNENGHFRQNHLSQITLYLVMLEGK